MVKARVYKILNRNFYVAYRPAGKMAGKKLH